MAKSQYLPSREKPKPWYTMAMKAEKKAEILIYDQIGQNFWGDGLTAKSFMRDLKKLGDVDTLDVRINSPGGNVMDGNAIYNTLRAHKATVNVFIDGMAASIASVIAMAGDKVYMPANAMMMIHDPAGMAFGKAEDLRKTIEMLDRIKEGAIGSYTRKTGLDDKKVSEMMSKETWMTAEEAHSLGFADEIEEEVKAVASFDPGVFALFKNVPESVMFDYGFGEDEDDEAKTPVDVKPKKETPKMTADEKTITMTEEQLQKAIADQVAASMKAQAEATAKAGNESKRNESKAKLLALASDGKILPAQAEMLAGQLTEDGSNVEMLIAIAATMQTAAGVLKEAVPAAETKTTETKTVDAKDFTMSKTDIPGNMVMESFVIDKFAREVLMSGKHNPTGEEYRKAVLEAEKHPRVKELIQTLS